MDPMTRRWLALALLGLPGLVTAGTPGVVIDLGIATVETQAYSYGVEDPPPGSPDTSQDPPTTSSGGAPFRRATDSSSQTGTFVAPEGTDDGGEGDPPTGTTTSPPPGEVPADFLALLQRLYPYSTEAFPDRAAAVYAHFTSEPAGLEETLRLGNAVVRVIDASGQGFGGADVGAPGRFAAASPEAPLPAGVSASFALTVRGSPFGGRAGSLPPGASMEVVGRQGSWLRVRSGGTEGWVSGYWVGSP